MQKTVTTYKGNTYAIVKNESVNGYKLLVPYSPYHVQFWYDRSARVWYCAPYDGAGCGLADADNAYRKVDILATAGEMADQIAAGTLETPYL